MSGYTGGRIVRIKLENFMTYDDLEFFPKSGLNLIIGLNGTGKSSIMCALCLGLAGKPQFTGRASHISEFVKYGCKQATIEIELDNPSGRNVVICRKITKEKSEWFINGTPANQNEVKARVKKFNIDTSNICQFLPQEKVGEFSRMDKKQRLENILQAIGEPYLFELYNDLKQLRTNYCKIEDDVRRFEAEKGANEEKSRRLYAEVEKQEERERKKEELKVLKNQKMLLEYAAAKNNYDELNQKVRECNAKKMEISQQLEKSQATEEKARSNYQKMKAQVDKMNKVGKHLIEQLSNNTSTLNELRDQACRVEIYYKNRIEEKENQKQKLLDLQKQIRGLEMSVVAKEEECKELADQVSRSTAEFEKLPFEISQLHSHVQTVMMEKNRLSNHMLLLDQRLAKMKSEMNQKMEILKKLDKGTFEGLCWLEDNQNTFKATVYLPILMQIKVGDSGNCKYIENHLKVRDLLAFVCEDKDDCNRLKDILKIQKKLAVNIVMAPDKRIPESQMPQVTSEMRRYGVECFLKDLFTAPEPVMRYLYECYQIHRIPVAKSRIPSEDLDSLLQRFSKIYAGDFMITGFRSRYGKRNMSVSTTRISSRNLLINNANDQEKEVLEKLRAIREEHNHKENEYEKLQTQLKELEKKLESYRQERKFLQDKQDEIKRLNYLIEQKTRVYNQKKSDVIDEMEEKCKATKKIQEFYKKKYAVLQTQEKLFKKLMSAKKEELEAMLWVDLLLGKLELIANVKQKIEEQYRTIADEYQKLAASATEIREKAKKLLVEAQKIMEACNTVHKHLPRDLNKVIGKIIHLEAELNLDSEADQSVINEYHQLKKNIDKMNKYIESSNSELMCLNSSIQDKKQKWLPPLESHIQDINRRFSQYFETLSCAGEIVLDTCGDSDDFLKYGLQIRVKFREEEPLSELSQVHHSGGECSVSAIIFILSLQELTEVPFRCIDEVNQGMDSINERKIYQLIADTTCNGKRSQYFLLTPKLLLDLSYHREVSVHVIYNSCFLKMKPNIKRHLEQMRSD